MTASLDPLTLADAMETIASLSPLIRDHAQKAESDRRLSDDVADAFGSTGLWAVFAPKAVGGAGLARMVDQYELIRAMSYEDTSAGWALFIGGGTPMIVGSRLPPEGRDEVFANGVAPGAGVFNPTGQVRPTPGGFELNGRWQFASVIHQADWVMANALVVDDDGRPTPGQGMPFDIRSLIVPRDDVKIVDDWHVAGLKGTGSVSFTIEDVTVPDRRAFSFLGHATIEEPAYRLPLFTLVGPGFVGVAVGIAQRARDEVIQLLPGRSGPPTFVPESENRATQQQLGRAVAAIRAADLSTRAFIEDFDRRVDSGADLRNIPKAEAAETHQHIAWTVETCIEAVGSLFRLGGATSIYEPGVLQRCWRDINVLGQHLYVRSIFHEHAAKAAMGMEVDAFNI